MRCILGVDQIDTTSISKKKCTERTYFDGAKAATELLGRWGRIGK